MHNHRSCLATTGGGRTQDIFLAFGWNRIIRTSGSVTRVTTYPIMHSVNEVKGHFVIHSPRRKAAGAVLQANRVAQRS